MLLVNILTILKEKLMKTLFLQNLRKLWLIYPVKEKMWNLNQAKTLEIVEKMLSDLKVKTEGTSTGAARIISINEKEIVSKENTDFDSLSSVHAKKGF